MYKDSVCEGPNGNKPTPTGPNQGAGGMKMIARTIRPSYRRVVVGLALASLVTIITLVSGGDGADATTFSPIGSLTFADTTPGSNSDISTTFNLDAPDSNFAATVGFTSTAFGVPKDADIPDGAKVGTLSSQATLGLLNGACATTIPVQFTFYDATTDTSNTVDPLPPGTENPLSNLAGDTNVPPDGIADIKPPPVVTKYPSHLNTLFDPDFLSRGPDLLVGTPDDINGPLQPPVPRARYAAATNIASAGKIWVILQ